MSESILQGVAIGLSAGVSFFVLQKFFGPRLKMISGATAMLRAPAAVAGSDGGASTAAPPKKAAARKKPQRKSVKKKSPVRKVSKRVRARKSKTG